MTGHVGRRASHVCTSVVVAARNSSATIGELLESLVAQDRSGFEVVISDNGSTDNTAAVAASFADRLSVRVIDSSRHVGIGFARRAGVEAARGDRLVFVDSDDTVNESYVRVLSDALADHDVVHAAQDDTRLNPPETLRRRRAPGSETITVGGWPLIYAGTMAIRRSVYDRVGGWATERDISEDTDLSWRLHLGGHVVHAEPAAVLYVRFRHEPSAAFRQGRTYGRFQARTNRMWRRHQVPVESEWTLVGRLARVLRDAPNARHRDDRSSWLFDAGLVGQRILTNVGDVVTRRKLRDPMQITPPSSDPALEAFRSLRVDRFEEALAAESLTFGLRAAFTPEAQRLSS